MKVWGTLHNLYELHVVVCRKFVNILFDFLLKFTSECQFLEGPYFRFRTTCLCTV